MHHQHAGQQQLGCPQPLLPLQRRVCWSHLLLLMLLCRLLLQHGHRRVVPCCRVVPEGGGGPGGLLGLAFGLLLPPLPLQLMVLPEVMHGGGGCQALQRRHQVVHRALQVLL